MKKFLWMAMHDEGIQSDGVIQGEDLLQAVMNQLQTQGDCFSLTPDEFTDDEHTTESIKGAPLQVVMEVAEKMIQWCEDSYIDGDSAQQVTVYDLSTCKRIIH